MFLLKALSTAFLSIAMLVYECRIVRNRSAVTSFVYVSHNLKSFTRHARISLLVLFPLEILCQPNQGGNVVSPFVPVRCKGFDRAPGTSRFTFATLFLRENSPLALRSIRSAARIVHFNVCLTIEGAFSIILHHGFNSSGAGKIVCNRAIRIG